MTEEEEWGAIGRLIDRLSARFPQLSGETVAEVVVAVHGQLVGAPIRSYVPVLVEHDARDRLKILVAQGGAPAAEELSGSTPRV